MLEDIYFSFFKFRLWMKCELERENKVFNLCTMEWHCEAAWTCNNNLLTRTERETGGNNILINYSLFFFDAITFILFHVCSMPWHVRCSHRKVVRGDEIANKNKCIRAQLNCCMKSSTRGVNKKMLDSGELWKNLY